MKDFDFDQEQILKRIDRQVTTIVAKMKMNTASNLDSVFFDNAEFIQVMNISKRTAQQWRDKNVIQYSMVGCKIYYTLTDVIDLLNNNKKKQTKLL